MQAVTTTETVRGFTFRLTDHGDHVTTGANTPSGEWASIIAQPQRALDGRTVWVAHLWFRGNLEGRSPYLATPAEAAAEVFEALLGHFGVCVSCGSTSVVEVCDACTEWADDVANGHAVTTLYGREVPA